MTGHGGTSSMEVLAVVLVLPSARLAAACSTPLSARPRACNVQRGASKCSGRSTAHLFSRALLGGAHRLIGSLVSFVHWTTSSRSTLSTPAVSWLLPLAGPARAVLEGAILFVPVLAAMVGGQQTALACIAASLLLWICCMLVRYRPRGTARDGSAAQTQHRWRAALRAASAAGQQAVESACQPPQRCVRPFWPARKYVRVCYVRHKKGLLPNTGTSHPFGRG